MAMFKRMYGSATPSADAGLGAGMPASPPGAMRRAR